MAFFDNILFLGGIAPQFLLSAVIANFYTDLSRAFDQSALKKSNAFGNCGLMM